MVNIDKKRLTEITGKLNDTYIYIKTHAKFYWVEKRRFFSMGELSNNLKAKSTEIMGLREYNIIDDYDDFCYLKGGKEKSFNLLDEETILKPSDNPILDENIKYLIENVCGNKQENFEYIYKAILYKYLNINDFTMPAIVLHGAGGSGKGTFISLMGTIFGKVNVLANLSQRDLSGSFDTFKGDKIVVEFAELSTNNSSSDYKILTKLKNLIGAEYITVNEKGVKQYQTNSIAWFFISSNSNKPLQLDDKDKGNRRFTIISSSTPLKNGEIINEVIKDKEKVSNLLARLLKTYPEVKEYKKILALNNEDKRELEDKGENEANKFWEWLKDNYPSYKGKQKVSDINSSMYEYCNDNGVDFIQLKKYFWNTSMYTKKRMRFGDKIFHGVFIK